MVMAGGGVADGMGMMAPPPSSAMPGAGGMPPMDGGGMMGMSMSMSMTFFWGTHVQILFSGWPGDRGLGMYILALLFVLAISALLEALSSLSRHISRSATATSDRRTSTGLLLTGIHGTRMGLAYLVMLAVMSFNVGILIAAIVGHALGFLLASSGIIKWARGSLPYNHNGRSLTK